MRDAQKDEVDNLVQKEFRRRMAKIEDCPPGWIAIKEKTKRPTKAPILEPCPIAVMEEPCPCIREFFEGSSSTSPSKKATLKESISEDRPRSLEESIKEEGALDCVDVYRDLRNQVRVA